MINVSILSPTDSQKFDKIKSISINGIDGHIKILPGHNNFISSLKNSELQLNSVSNKKTFFTINNGLFKFFEDQAVILVSEIALKKETTEKGIISKPLSPELVEVEKEIKYQKKL
jgi:F0F1-type ATP synthase epsilon subunit